MSSDNIFVLWIWKRDILIILYLVISILNDMRIDRFFYTNHITCRTYTIRLNWPWYYFYTYRLIIELFKIQSCIQNPKIKEWSWCFCKGLWVIFQSERETSWANSVHLMFDVAFKGRGWWRFFYSLTLSACFLWETGPCLFEKSPSLAFHRECTIRLKQWNWLQATFRTGRRVSFCSLV